MTKIDKIGFQFDMADEQFAKGLYADWDNFYPKCAIDIMNEFFSRYDNRETYIKIELLELNLGGIPQDDFYDKFPILLREALERTAMPYLNFSDSHGSFQQMPTLAHEKRIENLLHYLEYGFCLTEWDMGSLDLYNELLQSNGNADTERILSLLASKSHAMLRLFRQTDARKIAEILPFAAWLTSSSLGHHEKQRYLSAFLEYAPQEVIRFIHETIENGCIESMAELIENTHARRIMSAETEHHAEIDVPEYWYRLYGWLLEYYPFNGVPMFGDKMHFRKRLNYSLLSFIRKRPHLSFLSKTELTVQFLMEIFGAKHCFTVLNVIYSNQRLNADGTPASGDNYARELYYILLQLSLIKPKTNQWADNEAAASVSNMAEPTAESLSAWMKLTLDISKWLDNRELIAVSGSKADSCNLALLTDWLTDNMGETSEIRSRPVNDWWASLLLPLARLKKSRNILPDDAYPVAAIQVLFSLCKEKASTETFGGLLLLHSVLLSPTISDTAKSQLLRYYARWHPQLLWKLIGYLTDNNATCKASCRIPSRQWAEWLGTETCLDMISALSLSLGETLRQTNNILSKSYHVSESVLAETLVQFLASYLAERRYYDDASDTIHKYVAGLKHYTSRAESAHSGSCTAETDTKPNDADEDVAKNIENALHIARPESLENVMQPEYIEVPNAGLCLLALWLPRLLAMLGLLNEDKKDLKDAEARIRAIFILQRLATDHEKEYMEQELAFNRILTGCPFHIPLPKSLELTEYEIRNVEAMLSGVKANWNKLKATSVKTLQRSFIKRPGRMEQQEDKWVLHVEGQAYDLLLDSLPWSYSPIRLPWLKKKIQVAWRNKEELDFGTL